MRTRSLYMAAIALLLTSVLVTACCSILQRKPGPTATPTTTATPSPIPPTSTPAVTPTPLPPDQPVPAGVVSPIVVQHSPLPGEELSLDGAIELVFDRAMDKGSVEQAIEFSPALTGRFEWTDNRTVRFLPANLARGASYHVYLGQGARDANGAILGGSYRFRFNTVGFLEVGQVIPAADAQDVETDSAVTVIFNRPVVPLTTLDQQADLPDPLVLDPPASGSGEWLNTSIYVFTPDSPLAGGTRYTARIPAGLSDTTGGLLAQEYAWSFTTQPPKVVWTTPRTDRDRPVRPDTEVHVQFNQPIDPDSAREAFSLTSRGLLGGQVRGEFDVLTDTLVFRPHDMLDFDTTYVARVEASVISVAGGAGSAEPYEWQFKTVPPPRIVGTEPKNGESNARPYTSFEIQFNTVIDGDTVMPNLQMTPPLSPTQVYTYFSEWNYTFVLNFRAQPSTDYEVRIGPDIADPYGNTTGQRMVVRFRTAPLEPRVRLHVPGNVSTANANDPARLFVSYVNARRLDLKLYRLDQAEFLRFQREWWDFVPSTMVRNWRETVEAPLNEVRFARVDLAEDGKLAPGFYLVDLTSPDVTEKRWKERHLLIVSTVNLTVKTGDDAKRATTSCSPGPPIWTLGVRSPACPWRPMRGVTPKS